MSVNVVITTLEPTVNTSTSASALPAKRVTQRLASRHQKDLCVSAIQGGVGKIVEMTLMNAKILL